MIITTIRLLFLAVIGWTGFQCILPVDVATWALPAWIAWDLCLRYFSTFGGNVDGLNSLFDTLLSCGSALALAGAERGELATRAAVRVLSTTVFTLRRAGCGACERRGESPLLGYCQNLR